MILLAAAAIATASTPPTAPVSVRATATIRVVQAVRLSFDAPVNLGAPAARDAVLRLPDGSSQRARLIEFQ
jgi:hypothetical protein